MVAGIKKNLSEELSYETIIVDTASDIRDAMQDDSFIVFDKVVATTSFDSEKTYITWKSTPHFYQFNNLIVQYVGTDKIILDLLLSLCGEQFAGGNLY